MIISKTPLRISFAGGGSDLKSYYTYEQGEVVSVTLNKYIYTVVNKKFDDLLRISYTKTENVNNINKIKHRLVRVALKELQINSGIEIVSVADIPSKGTGLGSSSSFAVGLLNALYAYKQTYPTAEKLASKACKLEIDILKESIGKQDQYAASYGGFNCIQFNTDGTVKVKPIKCTEDTKKKLQKNLLMLYTGIQRSTSDILSKQIKNMESSNKKITVMKKMVKLAKQLRKDLEKNNLDSFGEILHENWMLKKQMTSVISNSKIDEWYSIALKNGAIGGKILGAGGGGFFLFYAPSNKHKDIIKALPHLKPLQVKFDYQGSRILSVY